MSLKSLSSTESTLNTKTSKSQLLSTPISFLLDQLDQQEYTERLKQLEHRKLESQKTNKEEVKQESANSVLWVDKYAATKFVDLLSDEVCKDSS